MAVIFWRTLLKIALAIVAVVVIALFTSGAVLFIQGLHHAVR